VSQAIIATAGKADEARHADVIDVVIFDEFLTSQCMDNGRLQPLSNCDELGMRRATAASREDGDLARTVQQIA
jgi:hypothetical protein